MGSPLTTARSALWLAANRYRLVLAILLMSAGLGSSAQEVQSAALSPEAQIATAGRAFEAGHFQAALGAWREAVALAAAGEDVRLHAQSLVGEGETYVALGRYPEAIDRLERALARASASGDAALVAATQGSLGNAHLLGGEGDEAARLLTDSIDGARALGRRDIAATAGGNLGTLLATRGEFGPATDLFRRALEDAVAGGEPALAARVRLNLARSLFEQGQSASALAELRKLESALGALAPSHQKSYGLISMGRLHVEHQPMGPEASRMAAYQAFKEAQTVAESTGDNRALSYALGYQGQLYEHSARYPEALQLSRRALYLAQSANVPELVYRWQWQVGRLLRAEGNPEAAIAAYRRAVYDLQSIRGDLLAGYGTSRSSFRELVGPIFLELADLLLEHSATLSDPGAVQDTLRQVRETVEVLKGAELADYFQDDCVAALKSRTAGIDQLAARTAALYPIIFPDRLDVLVSLPDGIKLFTSRVTQVELTGEIHAFRKTLEQRITHRYRRHAKRVHDWLMGPLEAELERQQIDTLVFVPDGPFRTVPLAALHDGDDFLIRKYAVATTPGLTLTDPKPIARQDVQMLLAGLTESVQGFPPLPNVASELSTIQGIYDSKEVLKDAQFKLSAVESELTGTPFSIVHIASHGQFTKEASNSFLLTYDGQLNMDALESYMSITGVRKQPVELLTLSACQTAAGDDRAALGLAGVAIKAGARSALATLWFINDQSSSLLVSEFYRGLRDPSLSKAKALQQAQLKLLGDRFYRHPSYWSPFLMIGNWL